MALYLSLVAYSITDKLCASDRILLHSAVIIPLVINVSKIIDSFRSSVSQWSVRIMIPHRYKELWAAVTKPSVLYSYVSTCSVYVTYLAQNLKVSHHHHVSGQNSLTCSSPLLYCVCTPSSCAKFVVSYVVLKFRTIAMFVSSTRILHSVYVCITFTFQISALFV
jgi:hypothetical protein